MLFTRQIVFLSPEKGIDIGPDDLDILDHNTPQGPGDNIADFLEEVNTPPGPDDGDGLGRNEIPTDMGQ